MADSGDIAEVYGGPFEGRPSIFWHIEEGLKKNPRGNAVIVGHQPSTHLSDLVDDGESRTQTNGGHRRRPDCLVWRYVQLHRAALKLAAAIMRLTLAPLDAGALTGPRKEELINFMRTLQPDIVVVPSASASQSVDAALQDSGVPSPALRVQLNNSETPQHDNNWPTLYSLARAGAHHALDEHALLSRARSYDPERIALLIFTSGTSSGEPKGCPRRVGGMTQLYNVQTRGPEMGPTTNFLFSTANFRIIAPGVAAAVWKAGGTVVMPGSSFAPEGVLDAIEEYGITHVLLLPAQVHSLVAHPTFQNRRVGTVKAVLTGGDVATSDLLFKMSAAFPSAAVCAAHGMTESGGFLRWIWYDTSLADIPYFGEIAPLGVVAKGARARIWDHEKGKVAKRGEPGELLVCSDVTIRHYLGDINEDSFYEDDVGRWFKTGDLGMINPDEVVYILGRIKDVVKRAGVPITPAALESSIGNFTGASTAVVAIPSPALGQEPFAVLQDFHGKSEAEVKQGVVDLFGNDYQLLGAASLKQLGLDGFPVNATSKVMKIELPRTVEEYLSRQK